MSSQPSTPPPGALSAVVTCYNYARYLDRALDSALSQTISPFEVIVVNDGSPDDTDRVVARYLRDPRVVYVKQARGGQAKAKNAGLARARGEFVAFLDADDFWAVAKWERQAPLFDDPDVGVVYARQVFVGEDDRPLSHPPALLAPARGRVTGALLRDNFVPFSSAVARRALLVAQGGFDESLAMSIDWDLWLKLSLQARFDYVDEPLLFYRQGHADQMSKNSETRAACAERIYSRFIEAHADVLSPADVRASRVYTYNIRAYHQRRKDPALALRYYGLSLRQQFFQFTAWRGALLTLFGWGGGTGRTQ